ncbi:hypothetical protein [Tolumonas lignilytica]|jgi:hypothetical protein|uniref:hypothetical protein n=1 Tax=Tolumonas lignilytica TaxID=1283284 RepID=UPI000463F5E1|nr:hypothetical protein [Tolumonas lignilytica]
MKHFLIPLSLIMFIAVAVWVDIQLFNVPMIRASPAHPVYTISSPDDAAALASGHPVIKLGPCLFGLYPGAIAFQSVQQAKDFMGLKGYGAEKWKIFQLSGDYQLDVTDGVLNKTLQLSREVTTSDNQ